MNASGKIRIRPFEQEDLEEVVALCLLHADFERDQIEARFCGKKLLKHLDLITPQWFCLIVERQDQIVGYASYGKQFSTWDSGHYLYLDCLFLHECARGQGIGERVMQSIAMEATRLRCSQVQWQTPDVNDVAIRFYERLGAIGKRKVRFKWNV